MASELQIFGDIAEPKKVLVLQQLPKVELDTLLQRAHQIREESARIQGEVEELSKAIDQAAEQTGVKKRA